MQNISRTIYGAYLQTCQHLNLPWAMKDHSTLNEKFGIQSGIRPPADTLPNLAYFAIGNGGHTIGVGNGIVPITKPLQHQSTDAACFNHLPFVLREANNDLTPTQQARYALRRQETHNNVTYFAYYLRRLDESNLIPSMQTQTQDGQGNVSVVDFIPTSDNLNPKPQQLSSTGVNSLAGVTESVSARLDLSFTADDVTELLNVANILWQDEAYAVISEIAMVSGVDKIISAGGSGTAAFNFNEVIAAQVCSFISCFFPAQFSNTGMTIRVDVGATEPLLKLS